MYRNRGFMFALLVLALPFASVLAVPSVKVLREKKTLNPTADSYVAEEGPNTNWGRAWWLRVEGDGPEILAFLMFDLGENPSGAAIEGAALRLYVPAVDIKAFVGVYYCSSNDWTEDGITYSNRPTFSSNPVDAANVTTASTWYEWNVTDTVQSAFEATDKRLSLVLKANTYGAVEFDSKDDPYARPPYKETRPQLVVVYEAPEPSGSDPLLPVLVAIISIGAAVIALELAYIHLKRRRQKPSPSKLQRKT